MLTQKTHLPAIHLYMVPATVQSCSSTKDRLLLQNTKIVRAYNFSHDYASIYATGASVLLFLLQLTTILLCFLLPHLDVFVIVPQVPANLMAVIK